MESELAISELKEELEANGYFVKEDELESGLRIVTVRSESLEQITTAFQDNTGELQRKFENAFCSQDTDEVEKYIKMYCMERSEYLRGICFSENLSGVHSSVMYLPPIDTYPDFQSFLTSIQNYLEH